MQLTNLQRERANRKIEQWVQDSRDWLALNHPSIDFDSSKWEVSILGLGKNRSFVELEKTAGEARLAENFLSVIRCFQLDLIRENLKDHKNAMAVCKLLVTKGLKDFLDLSPELLGLYERELLEKASIGGVQFLEKLYLCLNKKGILNFHWVKDWDRYAEIIALSKSKRSSENLKHWFVNRGGYTNVDHRVAAFSDLVATVLSPIESWSDDEKKVLGPREVMSILVIALKLCAPSRVNEVLCMSVNDRVTIESFAQAPFDYKFMLNEGSVSSQEGADEEGSIINLHRAHQRLFETHVVLTQKGSKGAQWGPKPVLSHMTNLCNVLIQRLEKFGERSRMLARHYEAHPNVLFMPEDLRYLREKKGWSALEIWKLLYFGDSIDFSDLQQLSKARDYAYGFFKRRADLNSMMLAEKGACGVSPSGRKVQLYDAKKVMQVILGAVHQSLRDSRVVTDSNLCVGKLSGMLMLTDFLQQPHSLVGSLKYDTINLCLSRVDVPKGSIDYNIFSRLKMEMIQNNVVVPAYIHTHDPRRFLTDNALESQNAEFGLKKISDVLVNGWARRKSLSQLDAYRRPFTVAKAMQAALPPMEHTQRLLEELGGLSEALQDYDSLVKSKAEEHGLPTFTYSTSAGNVTITTVNGLKQAHVGFDSLGSVRTIIPLRSGGCLNDHHRTPCQHIVKACLPCSQRIYIKGDLPKYEEVKRVYKSAYDFIYRQMKAYIKELSLGAISEDDAAKLFPLMISKDLDPKALTDDLIQNFERLFERLKPWKIVFDAVEEAFVAMKNIEFEESNKTQAGDSMRYNGVNLGHVYSELVNEVQKVDEKAEDLGAELLKNHGEAVGFLYQSKKLEHVIDNLNLPLGDDQEEAA